jgi:threonine synthase
LRPDFRPAPEAASIGVFCLPDSTATLAGLLKLSNQVRLTPEDDVVLLITGTGLKNLEALDPARMKIRTSSLSDLEGILSGLKA